MTLQNHNIYTTIMGAEAHGRKNSQQIKAITSVVCWLETKK